MFRAFCKSLLNPWLSFLSNELCALSRAGGRFFAPFYCYSGGSIARENVKKNEKYIKVTSAFGLLPSGLFFANIGVGHDFAQISQT